MGHYLCARVHGVQSTLPFFLPAPPVPFLIGTLGAFIRLRSLPPSRRALFDVGAAGPWAGFLIALPVAWVGLSLSELRPMPPSFTGLYFGDSLLFKGLSRATVGSIPHGFDIFLHPVAMAGWFGLFVTGLNLLPIGQLDGGHVVYSLFGRRHRWIARGFLLGLLALGFLGWNGWFVWAVLVTFAGIDHPPTTDRETPLDPLRRTLAWVTLALFLATLVPVPVTLLDGGPGVDPEELIPASHPVP
jgi:membrane-associated protease RseP (regulator of RpoE activity)